MRAQNDPLSMDELRAVTILEIEEAERALLEGCDYRLRSRNPYGAIKVLASDVQSFFMNRTQQKDSNGSGNESPRSVACDFSPFLPRPDTFTGLDTLCERALSIAQSALVYSDINFLFPPGQIAFATVALALDSHAYSCEDDSPRLGTRMREYMSARFSAKSEEEISEYEQEVSKIIATLENCSSIDLEMFSPFWQYHRRRYARTAEREAIKTRKAIFNASRLRVMSRATFRVEAVPTSRSPSPPTFGYRNHHHGGHHHHHHHRYQHHHYNQHHYKSEGNGRKRERDEGEGAWTPVHQRHNYHQYHQNKIARVTPINTPFI